MRIIFIAAYLLLLLSAPAVAAQTVYSRVIEDLPLMPGMAELSDNAVVFDKPSGRIVETEATTTASPASVRKFYAEALPPLGWKALGVSEFVRDRETLKIDIEEKKPEEVVHFTLTPASEGN